MTFLCRRVAPICNIREGTRGKVLQCLGKNASTLVTRKPCGGVVWGQGRTSTWAPRPSIHSKSGALRYLPSKHLHLYFSVLSLFPEHKFASLSTISQFTSRLSVRLRARCDAAVCWLFFVFVFCLRKSESRPALRRQKHTCSIEIFLLFNTNKTKREMQIPGWQNKCKLLLKLILRYTKNLI